MGKVLFCRPRTAFRFPVQPMFHHIYTTVAYIRRSIMVRTLPSHGSNPGSIPGDGEFHFALFVSLSASYKRMVLVGLEPTTLGLLDPRSSQLSYKTRCMPYTANHCHVTIRSALHSLISAASTSSTLTSWPFFCLCQGMECVRVPR